MKYINYLHWKLSWRLRNMQTSWEITRRSMVWTLSIELKRKIRLNCLRLFKFLVFQVFHPSSIKKKFHKIFSSRECSSKYPKPHARYSTFEQIVWRGGKIYGICLLATNGNPECSHKKFIILNINFFCRIMNFQESQSTCNFMLRLPGMRLHKSENYVRIFFPSIHEWF